MDGQDIDGLLLELGLGRGRVVPDLPEKVQVAGECLDGIVLDQLGEIPDLLEKQPDVLDLELGLEALRLHQALDIARLFEEGEHHLAGVFRIRQADEMDEVLVDLPDALHGLGGDLED